MLFIHLGFKAILVLLEGLLCKLDSTVTRFQGLLHDAQAVGDPLKLLVNLINFNNFNRTGYGGKNRRLSENHAERRRKP